MRGPRGLGGLLTGSARITPAYAGTTISNQFLDCVCWDHPRLCGDHCQKGPPVLILWGSPPLMRGPRGILPGDWLKTGITPAYAGTT